jgi:hypothetical protein
MTRPALRFAARLLGGVVAVAAAVLAFVYWYDTTGQRPDAAFDSTVAAPAYGRAGRLGPRVLFDVAHRNWHTPTGRYRPLADLLRHDGYEVRENTRAVVAAALDSGTSS